MDDKTKSQLAEIFKQLPKPIQSAITSAEVQKKMRIAADRHKLHLDQWEILEDEVLMALFGIKPVGKLQENIAKEVGVSSDVAASLTGDISEIVFAPIRQELERELEHPQAKEKEVGVVEAAREQMLGQGTTAVPAPGAPIEQPAQTPAPVPPSPAPQAPTIIPATPPPPPPTEKAIRMPASGAYVPGVASTVRKDVHDDPYREPPA